MFQGVQDLEQDRARVRCHVARCDLRAARVIELAFSTYRDVRNARSNASGIWSMSQRAKQTARPRCQQDQIML